MNKDDLSSMISKEIASMLIIDKVSTFSETLIRTVLNQATDSNQLKKKVQMALLGTTICLCLGKDDIEKFTPDDGAKLAKNILNQIYSEITAHIYK